MEHTRAGPATRAPRPRGMLRRALHLPVMLYRFRLGWLLGHRFLLLTHRGRKTGKIRQTLLEVLHYDRTRHESIVLSGWGTRADWYRNIQEHPPLEVRTGRHRYRPDYRVLTREEAAIAASRWEHEHPWEARLAPTVLRWIGGHETDSATRHALPADLPMVAFRPLADDASCMSQ